MCHAPPRGAEEPIRRSAYFTNWGRSSRSQSKEKAEEVWVSHSGSEVGAAWRP